MTPITAPADKRFLRAHVRPVRRRQVWRVAIRVTRTVGVAALVLFVAWRTAAVLTTSSVLRIEHITVNGTSRLSTGEVRALVGDLRGRNMLLADLESARQQVLRSPWVARAVLRRRLPSSIDVTIVERRPIGIARLPGGQLYLVDGQGTLIDEFGPKYAEFDLPMIDGCTVPGSGRIDPRRIELASRVLTALDARPDLARRVSQIDVSDAADAVVLMDSDTALLRLGDQDFRQRLEDYLDLAPALRERVASIDYVDLRYGSHVFVGTAGKDTRR